jgi:heme oxygenase
MQLSPLYLAEIQAAEDRGRQLGERREETLIVRQLNRRVGAISLQIQEKIKSLSLERLEDLGEALLDFSGMEDLTAWIDTNG